MVGWTDLARHYGVGARSFVVHQAGYFAMQNWVVWADRTSRYTWAPSADNTGYCTVSGRLGPARQGPVAEGSVPDQTPDFLTRILVLVLDATVADRPASPEGVFPSVPAP